MTTHGFQRATETIPHVQNGMFPSEVFLFLSCCRKAQVTRIIESGVKRGYSTRLLTAVFPGPIVSIDRDDYSDLRPGGVSWSFVVGEATDLIPSLLEQFTGERIGVLMDGPKGGTALALKDYCLANGVCVVGIHDLARGHGETIHSHDPVHRRNGVMLDARVLPNYAAAYPDGPGLALWTVTS